MKEPIDSVTTKELRESLIVSTLISLANEEGIIKYKIKEIGEILEKNNCLTPNSKYSVWILNQILNNLEKRKLIKKVLRFKSAEEQFKKKWSGFHYFYKISDWEQALNFVNKLPKIPMSPKEMKLKVLDQLTKKQDIIKDQ